MRKLRSTSGLEGAERAELRQKPRLGVGRAYRSRASGPKPRRLRAFRWLGVPAFRLGTLCGANLLSSPLGRRPRCYFGGVIYHGAELELGGAF